VITASNGRLCGQLETYTSPESLTEFGGVLEVFPRNSSDAHLWESGRESPEDRTTDYFRFRLLTTDKSGHCAVLIRFNNNRDLPDREISEFSISAEAADLHRLGRFLREFANLEHEVLYWGISDGKLFHSRAEFDSDFG
jgi:hypothetical protein